MANEHSHGTGRTQVNEGPRMTPKVEFIIRQLKRAMQYWSKNEEITVRKWQLQELIDFIEKTKEGQND